MRVLMGAVDDSGRGYYRCLFPAAAVNDRKLANVQIDMGLTTAVQGQWAYPFEGDPGGTPLLGVLPIEYDVLVMQLPMAKHMADAIPFVQANGTAVVVEVDDDMWAMPDSNQAFHTFHPKGNPWRNWEHLRRACSLADLVTVTTPELANVLGGESDRVKILPNCVPAKYLATEANVQEWNKLWGKMIVGWSGSPHTHNRDLSVCRNGIVEAVRSSKASFLSFGSNLTPSILGFDNNEAAWLGWVPFTKYPEVVAGFDVGVVPLADSRFNRCKSWLKGLEYAALGVPFVASPLPEYRTLAALGAGDLAPTASRWRSQLKNLLVNHRYREERTAQGRIVAQDWMYERRAGDWVAAWEQALANHRASAL